MRHWDAFESRNGNWLSAPFAGELPLAVAMARESLTDEETQCHLDDLVCEPRTRPHHRKTMSLPWPATTVEPVQIRWRYAVGIPLIHLLACLAFVPWLFSWTGVACTLLGLYAFGTLGINLCYHRLLTHQGFVAPKWLEHSLAILGVCPLQDTRRAGSPCTASTTSTPTSSVTPTVRW